MAEKTESTETGAEGPENPASSVAVSSHSEDGGVAQKGSPDALSAKNPELAQHPALKGAPEVEVEARSADSDGQTDGRWRKTFVQFPASDFEPNAEQIHEDNKAVLLQEAINAGVHPKGEPTFDGSELQRDGVSLELNYSVESVPSVVDADAPGTQTPRKQIED